MSKPWNTATIGEICSLKTGGTPSRKKPEYFGGEIKWLVSGDIHQNEIFECEGRISEQGLQNSNARLLPVNSVMIALNGQGKTRGTVALLRTEATCNQSLVSIYPNDPNRLSPEFLYINLHGRYQEIRRMTGDSGNDRRGLNMSLIKGIEIPVPPLPEQERIVAILDEAFEGIATATAHAERNLHNARELFQSVLQSTFQQKGEDWVETTFIDLCEKITVGHVGSMKQHYKPTGISFLRSQNIRPFAVDKKNLRFIDQAFEATLSKSRLFPGDVAIVRTGYPGTAAVIPESLGEANCSDLVIVRPSNKIDPHFVVAFFNSPVGRKMVGGKVVGAAQKHFNVTAAKEVSFPYPPIDEQKTIVQKLAALATETRRLEAIYQRKLAALAELKQSLLQCAFAGEL